MTTIDSEIEKFGNSAKSWWNLNGGMKGLHDMNRLRISLVQDGLISTGRLSTKSLEGIRIMDVGCGGGILSEALARNGAKVTGVDPGEELMKIARDHKANDMDITYICTTIEALVESSPDLLASFDAVIMSEVLEHVDNPELLVQKGSLFLKPGGSMFLTTFNRTFEAWLAGIIIAEYVLRLVPIGTHDAKLFVTPQECQNMVSKCGMHTKQVRGMMYNFLWSDWFWCWPTRIHYALHAVKPF